MALIGVEGGERGWVGVNRGGGGPVDFGVLVVPAAAVVECVVSGSVIASVSGSGCNAGPGDVSWSTS